MLSIELWCVGGLKEPYWKAACAEYVKRLSAWAKVTVHELREQPLPKDVSIAQIQTSLQAEGERLVAALPKDAYVTALCVEGPQISSEALAQALNQKMIAGHSRLCYLIGGSHGLSETVKRRADEMLSFSRMTMPHMLARVFLLEQLYRAVSILHGGNYHK
ncbi:MAG: 23S rRNA (pseudouridine(1915)-N(3))-methyltransferase RlmH [Ethanoligenens sp.]